MIPNFCKACGGRLEETEREYCKAKECQTFAKIAEKEKYLRLRSRLYQSTEE